MGGCKLARQTFARLRPKDSLESHAGYSFASRLPRMAETVPKTQRGNVELQAGTLKEDDCSSTGGSDSKHLRRIPSQLCLVSDSPFEARSSHPRRRNGEQPARDRQQLQTKRHGQGSRCLVCDNATARIRGEN